MTHSSIIAASFLILSLIILLWQYFADGKRIDLFNPKTLFQFYFILQLPLNLFIGVTYNLDSFLVLSPNTPEEDVISLGFTFLAAHLAMVIAYYRFGKTSFPFPKILSKKWIYSRTKIFCFIYYIIGYLSFYRFLQNNGGYRNFVENIEYFRAYGIASQGLILMLSTGLPVIAGLALAISLDKKDRLIFLKLIIILVISILPATQMGFRGLFIIPLFQMLFIYNFRIRKISFYRFFCFGLFVSVVFTAYGIYRSTRSLMLDGFDFDLFYNSLSNNPELLFGVLLRVRGADIVAKVISDTTSADYNFFIPTIFETLTIFIPRALWESKPLPTGVRFSQFLLGKDGGVSPTIVGDGYWNAGYFGVIVIMLTVGIIIKLYQNRLEKSWDNDSVLIIYSLIFPYLFLIPESPQSYLNGIILVSTVMIPLLLSFTVRFNKSNKLRSSRH